MQGGNMSPKKSDVWKHFKIIRYKGKKKIFECSHCMDWLKDTSQPWMKGFCSCNSLFSAQCNHCNKCIMYNKKQPSTGHLVDHLKMHGIEVVRRTQHNERNKNEVFYVSLMKYFVTSRTPFKQINNKYLWEALKCYSDETKRIEESAFRKKYFKQLAFIQQEVLQKDLFNVDCVNLTTDIVTKFNRSFIGITCHYGDDDFNLHSHLLELDEFNEKHTATNIAQYVETRLNERNLNTNVITSDSAANNNGLKSICKMKLNCIVHLSNLIVSDIVSGHTEVSELFKKINVVVEKTHISKETIQLLKNNLVKGEDLVQLKSYVKTRFNSLYYSFNSLIRMKETLTKCGLMEVKDWELINSMYWFFDVLNNIYEKLGQEKKITAHRVIKKIKQLFNVLSNTMKLYGIHYRWIGIAMNSYRTRLEPLLDNEYYLMACYFCPKNRIWFDERQYQLCSEILSKELENYDKQLVIQTLYEFANLSSQNLKIQEFWRMVKDKQCFLMLIPLARKYLFIQPTSIPSERVFSCLDTTLMKTKMKMANKTVIETVKIIRFLKTNDN